MDGENITTEEELSEFDSKKREKNNGTIEVRKQVSTLKSAF